MPSVSLPLININNSIVSNSIYGIAREITAVIKVANVVDIITMYNGSDITVTDGKVNISNKKADNLPTTISTRRLLVNITDSYNEDALGTTATTNEEHFPIFRDNSIDVSIYPIYLQTDYSIEFTYITPSKAEITKVVDDIRMNISRTRNICIHEIEYDYILPEVVEDFIFDVHANKSRLSPTPLEEYFRTNSTGRLHLITDLVGNTTRLAIREKQVRIVGLFDFSPIPEKPTKDEEVFKFIFTYKLTLDKPSHLVLRYPIMIGNKLLPLKYVEFLDNRDVKVEGNRKLSYSNSLYSLSHFEAHRQLENRVNISLPINVPSIDEFTNKSIHKGYIIDTSVLVEIDETDNSSLLNLLQIDPYTLHPLFLDYITLEGNYILHPYGSFVYIGLWQDNTYFNADVLSIDPVFNVKSIPLLSLFPVTRVLINYLVDVTMVNPQAVSRLLTYPTTIIVYTLNLYMSYLSTARADNKLIPLMHINFILAVIIHLLNKGEYDAISDTLIAIHSNNKHIYEELIRVLQTSYYIDHYRTITKHINVIPVVGDLSTFHNGIVDVSSRNLMKTVATSYITALRTGE